MGAIGGDFMWVAVFGFCAVVIWMKAREKEREALYRAELMKKLAETPAADQGPLMQFIRERDQAAARTELAEKKLPGLILIFIGVGLTAFLWSIPDARAAALVGLVPGSVGVALLVYAYVIGPKGVQ